MSKEMIDRVKNFKQFVNEISSDTFKSAINVSKERGLDRRTHKLGELYFNQFIGKPFLDGIISHIDVSNPQQGNYRQVNIEYKHEVDGQTKKDYIRYDIDGDIYDIEDYPIERKDAVILSKIAQHINPKTKFKETGKYFKIKGW